VSVNWTEPIPKLAPMMTSWALEGRNELAIMPLAKTNVDVQNIAQAILRVRETRREPLATLALKSPPPISVLFLSSWPCRPPYALLYILS